MYTFKRLEEMAWAVAVAVGVFAFTVLVDFDPDQITDLRAWVISLVAGCIRAGAGAALAFLRPS